MMLQGRISEADTRRLSRRNLLIGAGLLATAAIARGMVPRTKMDMLGRQKLEALIPEQIGPWRFVSKSGLVVPPEDQLSKQIYDQLVTRVYSSEHLPPMLLLVAQSPGQDGVLQVHRPETCYPASGFKLSNSRVHNIALPGDRVLPTRAFSAASVDRNEQLVYWTRIGNDLPTSWAQQRLSVAEANLRGEIPDAVMVRVSTLSPDPAALVQIDEFVQALISSMSDKARPILIGTRA